MVRGLLVRLGNCWRTEGFTMSLRVLSLVVALCPPMACFAAAPPRPHSKPYNGPACTRKVDDFFAREVWAKVGSALCVNCHKEGGDAEHSRLILQDPRKMRGHAQDEAVRQNREAFARLARMKYRDQSRLLVKVTGGLDHGGADVLKSGSNGYRVLAEFVRRINTPPTAAPAIVDDRKSAPFFDKVVMLEPNRLLRRVTLSLAGRLPTAAEKKAVADRGLAGLTALLDELMKEEAFYERLREGFNDIFLTGRSA
jgi:hypothetical protein